MAESREEQFRVLAEERVRLEENLLTARRKHEEAKREVENYERLCRECNDGLIAFCGRNIPVRQTAINGKLVRAALIVNASKPDEHKVTVEDLI